jgi:hypothetical protein
VPSRPVDLADLALHVPLGPLTEAAIQRASLYGSDPSEVRRAARNLLVQNPSLTDATIAELLDNIVS